MQALVKKHGPHTTAEAYRAATGADSGGAPSSAAAAAAAAAIAKETAAAKKEAALARKRKREIENNTAPAGKYTKDGERAAKRTLAGGGNRDRKDQAILRTEKTERYAELSRLVTDDIYRETHGNDGYEGSRLAPNATRAKDSRPRSDGFTPLTLAGVHDPGDIGGYVRNYFVELAMKNTPFPGSVPDGLAFVIAKVHTRLAEKLAGFFHTDALSSADMLDDLFPHFSPTKEGENAADKDAFSADDLPDLSSASGSGSDDGEGKRKYPSEEQYKADRLAVRAAMDAADAAIARMDAATDAAHTAHDDKLFAAHARENEAVAAAKSAVAHHDTVLQHIRDGDGVYQEGVDDLAAAVRQTDAVDAAEQESAVVAALLAQAPPSYANNWSNYWYAPGADAAMRPYAILAKVWVSFRPDQARQLADNVRAAGLGDWKALYTTPSGILKAMKKGGVRMHEILGAATDLSAKLISMNAVDCCLAVAELPGMETRFRPTRMPYVKLPTFDTDTLLQSRYYRDMCQLAKAGVFLHVRESVQDMVVTARDGEHAEGASSPNLQTVGRSLVTVSYVHAPGLPPIALPSLVSASAGVVMMNASTPKKYGEDVTFLAGVAGFYVFPALVTLPSVKVSCRAVQGGLAMRRIFPAMGAGGVTNMLEVALLKEPGTFVAGELAGPECVVVLYRLECRAVELVCAGGTNGRYGGLGITECQNLVRIDSAAGTRLLEITDAPGTTMYAGELVLAKNDWLGWEPGALRAFANLVRVYASVTVKECRSLTSLSPLLHADKTLFTDTMWLLTNRALLVDDLSASLRHLTLDEGGDMRYTGPTPGLAAGPGRIPRKPASLANLYKNARWYYRKDPISNQKKIYPEMLPDLSLRGPVLAIRTALGATPEGDAAAAAAADALAWTVPSSSDDDDDDDAAAGPA